MEVAYIVERSGETGESIRKTEERVREREVEKARQSHRETERDRERQRETEKNTGWRQQGERGTNVATSAARNSKGEKDLRKTTGKVCC